MNPQHQQRDRVDWPNLYFLAASGVETFRDARLITAQSKYVEQAYDLASLTIKDQHISSRQLDKYARDIINKQAHSVQEFVSITSSDITVCVNAIVVDEDVQYRVLNMVFDSVSQLNGVDGIVYFGPPLSFTTADIPWFYKH